MIPEGISTIIDGHKAATKTNIIWGTVVSVNPETQTMKVLTGESTDEIEVFINQNITLVGAGIRFMPIPYQTKAIIHLSNNINTHLGFFIENAESLTDSNTGKKQSGFLLQRYLEAGEVQLVGVNYNEIFLERTGNIYIKSGNNQYLKLDDTNALFEGQFGTFKFEMDEVRIRAGNIRRAINTVTNEDEYVTETNEDSTTVSYLKEFTVSVGTMMDTDATDYQIKDEMEVDQYPYDGFMSLASKVYNDQGTEETVLTKFLKFLLKFPAGISLSVDEEGSLVILDQFNKNFVRFKVGENTEDENNPKPLTEFEISINKSNFKINNEGELSYTLQDPEDANKNVAINLKKDTSIELKHTIDGSKFNDIKCGDTGVTITDLNANKIELTATGTKVTDKNSNTIDMVSSKITTTSGSDKIEIGGGKITITTASGTVTGGKLLVNGTVAPGTGPFTCLTQCVFTGCSHSGNEVSGT